MPYIEHPDHVPPNTERNPHVVAQRREEDRAANGASVHLSEFFKHPTPTARARLDAALDYYTECWMEGRTRG